MGWSQNQSLKLSLISCSQEWSCDKWGQWEATQSWEGEGDFWKCSLKGDGFICTVSLALYLLPSRTVDVVPHFEYENESCILGMEENKLMSLGALWHWHGHSTSSGLPISSYLLRKKNKSTFRWITVAGFLSHAANGILTYTQYFLQCCLLYAGCLYNHLFFFFFPLQCLQVWNYLPASLVLDTSFLLLISRYPDLVHFQMNHLETIPLSWLQDTFW